MRVRTPRGLRIVGAMSQAPSFGVALVISLGVLLALGLSSAGSGDSVWAPH